MNTNALYSLIDFYQDIQDRVSNEDIDSINKILSDLNVATSSVVWMIATLRYTYSSKDVLSEWKPAVDRVRRELLDRGANVSSLMIGLL